MVGSPGFWAERKLKTGERQKGGRRLLGGTGQGWDELVYTREEGFFREGYWMSFSYSCSSSASFFGGEEGGGPLCKVWMCIDDGGFWFRFQSSRRALVWGVNSA